MITFILEAVLAVVFGIAGIAKSLNRKDSREAITAFGIPEPFAAAVGVFLPLAELTTAGLLLSQRFTNVGAWLALGLLVAFSIAIAVNLLRGQRPDCRCFGQLHPSPISWKTLFRNGVLLVLALMVLNSEILERSRASEVVGIFKKPAFWLSLAGGLILALLWTLVHLLYQHGRILIRLDNLEAAMGDSQNKPASMEFGLPIGSKAPSFVCTDKTGAKTSLENLLSLRKPLILLFTDPFCKPCASLLIQLTDWENSEPRLVTLAAISRETDGVGGAKGHLLPLQIGLLQLNQEISDAYRVVGTPSAILVNDNGTIASKMVIGAEAIFELIEFSNKSAAGSFSGGPDGVKVKKGETAPSFTLLNVLGESVDLRSFHGSKTLLLFWNPECGFCSRMVPFVNEFEDGNINPRLNVLLISVGSFEMNKKIGVRAKVLLDPVFSVGRAYGARATPSGCLVDENGNIQSEVVQGADAVVELYRSAQESHFIGVNSGSTSTLLEMVNS